MGVGGNFELAAVLDAVRSGSGLGGCDSVRVFGFSVSSASGLEGFDCAIRSERSDRSPLALAFVVGADSGFSVSLLATGVVRARRRPKSRCQKLGFGVAISSGNGVATGMGVERLDVRFGAGRDDTRASPSPDPSGPGLASDDDLRALVGAVTFGSPP